MVTLSAAIGGCCVTILPNVGADLRDCPATAIVGADLRVCPQMATQHRGSIPDPVTTLVTNTPPGDRLHVTILLSSTGGLPSEAGGLPSEASGDRVIAAGSGICRHGCVLCPFTIMPVEAMYGRET